MSTVDEVLATAEVVDAVCVIDGETRVISVPNEYKELGVESDEKVTRIKFQCPKIVGDNVDLTEYNLYINYRNAANKLNSYLVEDVAVTDNTLSFSWLLSRHVTESPGTISYIVCAKKSDDTGVINEWNTKVATGTVGVGLEATQEIEEQNIDVIEQILRSIVELENKVGGGGSGGIGEAGGYYTPAVDAAGNLTWTASKTGMPAVDGANIKGAQGKSAYQYAQEGGYTGTEAELAAKLAAEKFANPNALTFTGAVTGSYDGSEPLTVNIPSGGGSGGSSIAIDETLTEQGKAADAKAVGDAINSLSSVQTYKTEDIGELYAAPSDYSAWCPGNLRWDGNLQKFVSLIYAAPAHSHSTADLYVCCIDPDSFSATQPEKCRYVDTNGETDITPDTAGTCSFLILSDGTYLMIHLAADGNTYKFTSADNGATWKKVSAVTGYSGSPWNMTELSNGRIIMSDDASKVGFYYSDDGGVTFTQVIPGTCGGGYEAEACILEVQPGKLIAIARYSMSGKGYYESGDSEAAIFASSDDYGTTWSDWHISTTIDNMNASSCTGVVHDGIVEIFAASRWYSNGSNVNTDNANTGKNGAMIHYMATVANALIDNFTRVGIIDYARGAGGEYHSPCAAIDADNRLLIVHMDGGEAATCNNRYLRGGIGNISYACTDNSLSTVKAFSAATVTKLLAEKQDAINYLQLALSKIDGSGVTPPTGTPILAAQYIAADMASSLIYPWSEGSDFYGNASAQYTASAGATSTVHEFLLDNNVYKFKTYGLIMRSLASNNAVDNYISYHYAGTAGIGALFLCVADGYVSAVNFGNSGLETISASGSSALGKKANSGDVIDVHAGYMKLNETEIKIPKIAVNDFLANYTGYAYFKNIIRLQLLKNPADSLSDEEIASVTTLSNMGAVYLPSYNHFYSFKYYETY